MRPKNKGRPGAHTCVTLGDWLAFAEDWFEREHIALGQIASNAHDEALYLLLRTLDLPLDSPPSVLERKLTAAQARKVAEMLRRRVVDRVPAAYLTHEAWLGDERFYVDERVIIPRSYFLELIPDRLAKWLGSPAQVRRAVDVCTGSGCLAILLARHYPRARIDAIDLSPDALAVARINVDQHRLRSRVTLHRSDVFDDVPPAAYDLILSNPPYEPSAHVDAQAPEFKAEPRLAHDGGKDGMTIVRKLLAQARSRLAPDGIVVMEVGGLRAALSREFAAQRPHWLTTADGSNCVVVFRARDLI